jgi:hypothetical protein
MQGKELKIEDLFVCEDDLKSSIDCILKDNSIKENIEYWLGISTIKNIIEDLKSDVRVNSYYDDVFEYTEYEIENDTHSISVFFGGFEILLKVVFKVNDDMSDRIVEDREDIVIEIEDIKFDGICLN